MNLKLKIFVIGILLCSISYGLMFLLDYFIFIKLGDWTLPLFKKYLVIHLTLTDMFLVRWFPLILAVSQILTNINATKIYFKTVLWSFVSVIGMLISGILIALLTWTNEKAESPLLPEFLKYQPFEYYWTIFIIGGLMISILIMYFLKRKEIVNVKSF